MEWGEAKERQAEGAPGLEGKKEHPSLRHDQAG